MSATSTTPNSAKVRTSIPSRAPKLVKIALWISLFLPLPWIAWKFFSIISADPAKELNHLFGRVAFYALALNLTIGSWLALHRILKRRVPPMLVPIVAYRRHLGVAGALFLIVHVGFHFIIEAGLQEGFAAIFGAKYLWFGFMAFLGLLILAATSNDASVRFLKRRWKTLHRASYPIFVLASTHTLMIEKADLLHYGLIATLTGVPLLLRLTRHLTVSRQVPISKSDA